MILSPRGWQRGNVFWAIVEFIRNLTDGRSSETKWVSWRVLLSLSVRSHIMQKLERCRSVLVSAVFPCAFCLMLFSLFR